MKFASFGMPEFQSIFQMIETMLVNRGYSARIYPKKFQVHIFKIFVTHYVWDIVVWSGIPNQLIDVQVFWQQLLWVMCCVTDCCVTVVLIDWCVLDTLLAYLYWIFNIKLGWFSLFSSVNVLYIQLLDWWNKMFLKKERSVFNNTVCC